MKAAFCLGGACPATRARVLPAFDGLGAGPAPDAGIAIVVQRVVWQIVRLDVFPDLIAGPGRKRVQLDHLIGVVPLDEPRVSTESRLVAADACDPGAIVGEELPLGNHLADLAAGIGIAFPQFVAVAKCLLWQRDSRVNALESNAKSPDQFIP